MKSLTNSNIAFVLLCLFFCSVVNGTVINNKASGQSFQLPHLKQQIIIDGKIDDLVWQQALRIKLDVETTPGENIKAPVSTTAYLFEDGKNLYVAMKADDPDPSRIRAHYHDHDYIFDDDLLGFKLDTYHDDISSYQFFINALGVKHDSIEDDVLHEDDLSWNAIWDAAAIVTEHGFQVEFAIPLRILRFDDSKPLQEWGFDLLRFYPREVTHRISHHGVDRDISCTLCQNATLTGLKDVKTGKNLSLVPFMTATNHKQRDNPLFDGWDNTGTDTDFGADIRWGITPDTTLNATINPDFSQVESDVAQLDINNTFSLFFPEKRHFFIEGADYYKSLMNLVYTRNISDPEYGAKVTHSSDNNNFAAFLSNDKRTNYILPGSSASRIASYDVESNNAVLRYRHDLENASSIGAMVTLRDADNYHNYVYGVDGLLRMSDADVIRAQLLLSDTEDPQQIVDDFSLAEKKTAGSALDVHYRHQDRDWIYWTRYTRMGKGFRADLGYQPRVDYHRVTTGFRRYWYSGNDHWWHTISAGMDTRNVNNLKHEKLQNWVRATLEFEGPAQSKVELNISTGDQYWNNRLYDTEEVALTAQVTPLAGLVLNFDAAKEASIDYSNSQPGDLLSLSPQVTLNLGLHFQAVIQYTSLTMDVAAGELFQSKLLDARLIYQFSVQSFLRLVVQYNETERQQALYNVAVDGNFKDLGTQLLYSYKINQQTVFFLGYSDTAFDNDNLNKLEKTGKTLFMKMSYSWLY